MNQIIEEYNNSIKEAIKSTTRVTFFDTSSLMDLDNPYNLIHRDGIHFNTSGHAAIAKALGDMTIDIVS